MDAPGCDSRLPVRIAGKPGEPGGGCEVDPGRAELRVSSPASGSTPQVVTGFCSLLNLQLSSSSSRVLRALSLLLTRCPFHF